MAALNFALVILLAVSHQGSAASFNNCAQNDNGFCFCRYGSASEWCWVTNDGLSEFTTETYMRDKGYKNGCADNNDFSSDKFCENAKATSPNAEGEGGWRCPAGEGCPGGGCTAADWKDWVAAHNIFRCMHDVPPLEWSHPMGQDTYYTFNNRGYGHTGASNLPPPKGPSGENLGTATYRRTPMQMVQAWYSEVADCNTFPGCPTGRGGKPTGHFTAMIWKGAREIGCYTNSQNVQACRYKGEDTKGASTPNMGGHYAVNVPPRVKSFSECKEKVKQCGFSVEGSYNQVTGLSIVTAKLPVAGWLRTSAGLALAVVLSLSGFLLWARRVSVQYAGLPKERVRGLSVAVAEPLASGEEPI